MNAQGLDAHGKEDQVEKTDGGAASPLQHGVMPTCPECNGLKGYEVDNTPYYVNDPEERQSPEWRSCETCKGEGVISRLQLAVYKARGGPAPVKIEMWA